MKTFLFEIYRTKASTHPFITECVDAETESEAQEKIIGKKFYWDSDRKREMGTCRKARVINVITWGPNEIHYT